MTILKVLPNFNQVSFRNNSNRISFRESSGSVLANSTIEDSFVKEKDNKKRNILIASGVGVALLICAYFAGRKGLLGDAIKKFLTGAKNNGGSAINPPAGGNTGASADGSVVEEINTGVKKLIRKRRDGTLLKEIEKNEKGDVIKILYYDKSGKNVKSKGERIKKTEKYREIEWHIYIM